MGGVPGFTMAEDERYYLPCPLRKNQARIPVTVCIKERCIYIESVSGKTICGFNTGTVKYVRNRAGGYKRKPNVSK
jgi:hypothetical protein